MINTIYGPMDQSELEKKTGRDNGSEAFCDWVEYWLKGELVHRSINVTITGVSNKAELFEM